MKLFTTINNFLWGYVLIIFILGVGLYITFKIKFLQLKILRIIKEVLFTKTSTSAEGDISAFSALNVALSGTVGVGNIAGVATAIALGGPGAVFWMWISGIVGMATKFAEVYLGVKFRVRQNSGPFIGGPMMYIKNGLPQKFHFLAYIYALFGAAAAFG
ncbi:MAG: alanine:cation symporter family protein, partial [Endomicrobia bacterium]|nr:alanine:cation symporter family protein [Endomicrobiia bacterium]